MAYYININEWKPEQVFEWIRGLSDSISVYGKNFVDHDISGSHLMNFGPDDLQMIGIKKLGHKLEMMAAVNNLRESHFSMDYETLQSLALRVSSKSRSLMAEIMMETPEERLAMTRGKVTSATLAGVTDLLRSVKDLLFWLDRPPFEGQEPYTALQNTLVKISIEMATNAQRDQFAEDPVDVIKKSCSQIITLCEKVVVEFNDPYIAQPATLDVATVKARQDDEMKLTGDVSDCWFLGMHITTNHRGIHLVDGIRFQSAAHQTGKIEVGDEIVQVNYQTVLSWDHKNLQTALLENPAKVILTVKKRPKHSNTFGQIYIKPYRLPSKKRDSSFRWSEHISSPRHLVIPTVEIASSPAQNSETCQSEIPSEASGGESECDDDTFAAPSLEVKKEITPVATPAATQLYLPKPRVGITRRATVTGVAPSLTLVMDKAEDLWSRHSNTNNLLSQTRPHSLATYACVNTPLLSRSESFGVISELTEYGKISESVIETNNNNVSPRKISQTTKSDCVNIQSPVIPKDGVRVFQGLVDCDLPPRESATQPTPPPRPVRVSAEFEVTKGQLTPSRIVVDEITPPPRPPLSRTSSKNLVIDTTASISEVFSEDPPALPPRTPHAKAPPTPLELKPTNSNLEFPAVMPLPPFLTQRVEPPPRTVSPLLGLRLHPPKPEEIHVALDRPKTRTAELGRSVPCRSLQEIDCQGWLYRRRISRSFLGGTRWTRRWYVLRKNTVYGYKDQEDQKAESLMCLSGFNISATVDKSKKFVFKIHHSASSFFFACETQEEFDRWISCLQTACSNPGTGSSPVPRRECYYSETDDDSIGDGERDPKSPSPRKKLLGLTLSPSVTRKNRTPPGLPTSASASGLGFFSKASPEKVGAASLDRKYLRFLSHDEKPMPTPQYRSYRKPSAEVKKQQQIPVQKPAIPQKPSRMTKSESPPARPPTIAERRMNAEPRGRALTEPLRLNLKKSPDNSPQRSNVSSRRSSLDQSRRSSVESRTSPLSPGGPYDTYVGVSPEKAWMNSLRRSKPPVPPKSRSPDSAKLKSVANYQSVKLPLTPDRPMQLAFEMTLDTKKTEKSKFLGLTSPKFGRKVSPAPETPSRFQRTFFGNSSERKKRKGSDNYENLSTMTSGEESPSSRSLVRRDSLLNWSRRESPLPKPEESPRRPILSPLLLVDDAGAGPLSPRSCKPTMGVSMIGKQRRTPGVNGADVFVYSPPPTPGSASNVSIEGDALPRVSSSTLVGVARSQQQESHNGASVSEIDQSQRSALEYPPVFEPGTYSLQRKPPPRPAPRTKFFSTDLDSRPSEV